MNAKTVKRLRKGCMGYSPRQWREAKRRFLSLNWIERTNVLKSIDNALVK